VTPSQHVRIEAYLACCVARTGRPVAAEAMLRPIHAEARARCGDEADVTLMVAHSMSNVLHELGRHDESAAILQLVYDARRRRYGDADATTLDAGYDLACAWSAIGRHVESTRRLHEVYERTVRLFGPDHAKTVRVLEALARGAYEAQRWDDAESWQRRVCATLAHRFPPTDARCVDAQSNLAAVLHAQEKLSACMAVLRAANLVDRCLAHVVAMRRTATTRFPIGTRVVIEGLVSSPQYNGCVGTVVQFDDATLRYGVRLSHDGGVHVRLAFERLRRVDGG